MEEKYIVYLHINKTNNKVYVGITSMAVNNRWREGKGYIKCEIMNRAILKYGWNNFEHIILCKTSKDRAIVLEQYLIRHYKRKGLSYNISNGGQGVGTVSEYTKNKLRKYVGSKASMLWQTSIKRNYRDENTLLAHRKIILQFNLDGEFIKEFNSIKEASEEIGVSKSEIVHCLKGKTKKAGGYKWEYKYE